MKIKSLKIPKWVMVTIMAVTIGFAAWSVYKNDVPAEMEQQSRLASRDVTIVTSDGKTHSFNLEIAETPVDMEVGLMYRESMADNHGMMFLMGRPARDISFWMKNTLIPLDIIFIGDDGKIASIHRNAQPKSLASIPSTKPVVAVIELNGGRVDALGIKVGDTVKDIYFAP